MYMKEGCSCACNNISSRQRCRSRGWPLAMRVESSITPLGASRRVHLSPIWNMHLCPMAMSGSYLQATLSSGPLITVMVRFEFSSQLQATLPIGNFQHMQQLLQ